MAASRGRTRPPSALNMPDVPSQEGELPVHIEVQRTRMTCLNDINTDTKTFTSSGSFAAYGFDNSLDLDSFHRVFNVNVVTLGPEDMEFELLGIDPAIANAFRRILIAEVPTMAIEKVFFVNNTSVIQDEVLAHRLGLVPLAVDPAAFAARGPDDEATERNTIVLRLFARCSREAAPPRRLVNDAVYSSALEWLPHGSALPPNENTKITRFAAEGQAPFLAAAGAAAPRPVHPDILLAKLRPGQEIDLEAHVVRGTGREHAKWSPVGTAWYQLVPEVVLLQRLVGLDADRFAAICPKGCFGVDGATGEARVLNRRGCQLCREKVRALAGEDGWADKAQLRKIKDAFIFNVESTGALPPERLFGQAIDLLATKCRAVLASF